MKNLTRPHPPSRPGKKLPASLIERSHQRSFDTFLSSPDERGLPDPSWLAWKEAVCEGIFEWHGPQWEDKTTRERFAQKELLPYFKEGFPPLEAERAWWRALCTKRHRPPPDRSYREAFIEPDEVSVRSVYDSVLIRNTEQLRGALALLEKRTDARPNPYVEEMRKRLQMMEKELVRRKKETEL